MIRRRRQHVLASPSRIHVHPAFPGVCARTAGLSQATCGWRWIAGFKFLKRHLGLQLDADLLGQAQVTSGRAFTIDGAPVLAYCDLALATIRADSPDDVVSFFASSVLVLFGGGLRFRFFQRSPCEEFVSDGVKEYLSPIFNVRSFSPAFHA